MLTEKLLEGLLGLEDSGVVTPDRPVRQVVQSLVSEQILIHQEGLRLWAQDGQIEHRHVPLSLQTVQEHPDLHAELYSVLRL